jgi:hypothetical protein
VRSPPPHKLTNGIFSKLKAVEKSASLIVEALYSGVKNILRRSRTRCKDRISRVFPAFLRPLLLRVAVALWVGASGSFFVPTRTKGLHDAS